MTAARPAELALLFERDDHIVTEAVICAVFFLVLCGRAARARSLPGRLGWGAGALLVVLLVAQQLGLVAAPDGPPSFVPLSGTVLTGHFPVSGPTVTAAGVDPM